MPTAGRLMGAICFGLLGAYLALLTVPYFEEGKVPSYWWPLCIGAGIWAGWVVVGSRGGRGYLAGMGNGLTGVAAHVFWIVFVISFLNMIQKSMRKSYDGPLEALVNVFQLGFENIQLLGKPEVLVAVLFGGVVGGLITEYFASRFP